MIRVSGWHSPRLGWALHPLLPIGCPRFPPFAWKKARVGGSQDRRACRRGGASRRGKGPAGRGARRASRGEGWARGAGGGRAPVAHAPRAAGRARATSRRRHRQRHRRRPGSPGARDSRARGWHGSRLGSWLLGQLGAAARRSPSDPASLCAPGRAACQREVSTRRTGARAARVGGGRGNPKALGRPRAQRGGDREGTRRPVLGGQGVSQVEVGLGTVPSSVSRSSHRPRFPSVLEAASRRSIPGAPPSRL